MNMHNNRETMTYLVTYRPTVLYLFKATVPHTLKPRFLDTCFKFFKLRSSNLSRTRKCFGDEGLQNGAV